MNSEVEQHSDNMAITRSKGSKSASGSGLITFVSLALGLSGFLFGASTWNSWANYQSFNTAIAKQFKLQTLSHRIVYLDEVLTMSARLSASTGNLKWEERYNHFVPQLDSTIKEVIKQAPDTYNANAKQTDEANLKLVNLEAQSFRLVRQGQAPQALKILLGAEYEALKQIYAKGISTTLDAIQAETESRVLHYRQSLVQSLLLAGLSFPILVVTASIINRRIRSYVQEREHAQRSLQALNQELESREGSLKQEAEAKRQSEATLRALIKAIPDLLIRMKGDGTYLGIANSNKHTVLNPEQSDAGTESIYDILPFEVAEQRMFHVRKALETGELQVYEQQLVIDQQRVHEEVRIVVTSESENEVLAIVRDITDRRLGEAALRHSEARNRAFVSAIPDLIIRFKQDGTYLDIVEAKAVGMIATRQKRIGSTVHEVLPRQLADQYLHHISQAIQSGETQEFEYQLKIGERLGHYEGRMVRSGTDEAILIVRDITDRKRAEADLRQSEATNRALINAIPDLLLRVRRDGTYLDNAVGADRLKLFSGETTFLAKTTVRDSLPIEQAQQRMAAIEQALQTGSLQVYEHRLVINGKSIDEEVRIVVIGEDEVLVMVRDISDHKQAEAARRIAEENYRSIFEHALEGIFQSSPEGRFINVNPAMAKIYGYDSPQEMLNTITDIGTQVYVDPEDQAEFQRQLEQHDQVKDFEYRVYQKDSEIIWVQEDTRAVRDGAGQLLYYEGMIQDITDRKRRENELRKQLEELKIEIDHKKRETEVAMLTESGYFQEVQQELAEISLDEFWS